jgi:hypothetical protein
MWTAGLVQKGYFYEKIAFARGDLLCDGAGAWELRSTRERGTNAVRVTRAQNQQHRYGSGCALSLLVA